MINRPVAVLCAVRSRQGEGAACLGIFSDVSSARTIRFHVVAGRQLLVFLRRVGLHPQKEELDRAKRSVGRNQNRRNVNL